MPSFASKVSVRAPGELAGGASCAAVAVAQLATQIAAIASHDSLLMFYLKSQFTRRPIERGRVAEP